MLLAVLSVVLGQDSQLEVGHADSKTWDAVNLGIDVPETTALRLDYTRVFVAQLCLARTRECIPGVESGGSVVSIPVSRNASLESIGLSPIGHIRAESVHQAIQTSNVQFRLLGLSLELVTFSLKLAYSGFLVDIFTG